MLNVPILGALPPDGQWTTWLIRRAMDTAHPHLTAFASDPAGYVSRIGEVLVWENASGRQVIAGLQGIGESQARIEQAVSAVEATQLGMSGSLDALQAVSMTTLGVASLSGACILWRLNALNKRLSRLESTVADIEEHLSAQDKAHLRQGVSKLREFDHSGVRDNLLQARDEGQYAANVYGDLARREANGKKRLAVLNYRGRCYLLALMTELRARMLLDGLVEGLHRLDEEQTHLREIAQATFHSAIGNAPESFLDPNMRSAGVTLELLTEIYEQAQAAGAIDQLQIRTASQMFEHLRERVYGAGSGLGWVWSMLGEAQQEYIERLRYLMACLEDTNRLHGLRLLLSTARERGISLEEIATKVEAWRRERLQTDTGACEVVGFALG